MTLKVNEMRSYDIILELWFSGCRGEKFGSRTSEYALQEQSYYYDSILPADFKPEYSCLYESEFTDPIYGLDEFKVAIGDEDVDFGVDIDATPSIMQIIHDGESRTEDSRLMQI